MLFWLYIYLKKKKFGYDIWSLLKNNPGAGCGVEVTGKGRDEAGLATCW